MAPPPASLEDWTRMRQDLRATLWDKLGVSAPDFTPAVKLLSKHARDGYDVEHFAFDNGAGAQVYGYLVLPHTLVTPAPAVLYHHMHGYEYGLGKDELFQHWLIGKEPGPALAAAGFVVLAIDTYSFGERQTQGPAGKAESGADTELALFKHFLWQGATSWGMIVRDDMLALNYLLSRPEVDPARVGVTGMSMGGSRTTWLGALDERPRVLVPVCQMTRYQDFAASGRYNLHGIYYYVPGMLATGIDMEHIVSLAAPRPQQILLGDSDPLSPVVGVNKVLDYARQIYRLYDAEAYLQATLEPGVAHDYTPTMFAAMVDTMRRYLQP